VRDLWGDGCYPRRGRGRGRGALDLALVQALCTVSSVDRISQHEVHVLQEVRHVRSSWRVQAAGAPLQAPRAF
jgi:adenylosuccinate synthase